MAKSNVLVRVEADTKNYDANIRKARQQLERFGEDNLSAGGILKQLSGSLVGVAAKFTSFGAAAAAAMKVVKDAFMSTESNIDAWEGTVASAKSVYESFVYSLNSGDFSGFLSNLDNVVSKAKEAYEALDELGTRMTIINPERAKLQTRQTELKSIIRREGAGSEAGQRAQAELRSLEPKLVKAFQKESQLNYNAFEKEVDRMLGNANIRLNPQSRQTLLASFANDDLFQKIRQNARGSKDFKVIGGPDNQRVETVDTRNTNAKLLDLFTDEWRQQWSQYLTASFNARGSAASMLMGDAKFLKDTTTGGKGGKSGATTKQEVDAVTGSIDAQAKKVQELQKAWRAAATDSAREDYRKQIEEAQFALDKMMGKTSGIPGMNYGMGDLAGKGGSGLFQNPLFTQNTYDENNWMSKAIAHSQWKLDEKAIKAVSEYYDRKTNETTVNLTKEVGNIANGISGILSGIESLGIDLPDGLKDVVSGIQGVIGILSSISTIVTAIQSIETIAAAGSIIPYARGGIAHAANGFVPGNRYSTDDIPVAVSSGELILNRAQQGALASQLQNNQQRGPELARVSGEQIYVAMSNYLRRSGKGELITWR